jgi:hypothetical protein
LGGASDIGGGRQGFDLFSGHVWIGGEERCSTEKMPRSPFDESVSMIGNGSRRRTIDMVGNGIEHRSCVLGEFVHELAELAVEVAKEQQSFFVQNREARGVNRAYGIRRLE